MPGSGRTSPRTLDMLDADDLRRFDVRGVPVTEAPTGQRVFAGRDTCSYGAVSFSEGEVDDCGVGCGLYGFSCVFVRMKEAGVGKGTLFRRFGDRDGLLVALLDETEGEFHEAYTCGPPPLGPGAPPADRLTAFGCVLIGRIGAEADLGASVSRASS